MQKDLKNKLLDVMKSRGVKIPAFSKQTGIPKDRIYKWFQQGTHPKAEDYMLIEKWLNGENSNNSDKTIIYKDKLLVADRVLIDVMLLEIAKLKSKVYGMSVDDAIDELEKNAQLLLRKVERST
jgi:predicted transcriptional regulator